MKSFSFNKLSACGFLKAETIHAGDGVVSFTPLDCIIKMIDGNHTVRHFIKFGDGTIRYRLSGYGIGDLAPNAECMVVYIPL